MRIQATAATYNRFVREGGLHRLLWRALSGLSDDDRLAVEVRGFTLGEPPLDVEASRRRGETYGAPLRIQVKRRAVVRDEQGLLADEGDADVEEWSFALGIVPLMTDEDTLVLDGVDHVLEAAAKDLPGLSLEEGWAVLTPHLGAQLRFDVDRGLLIARIDGGPKLHATVLLHALGVVDSGDILCTYHDVHTVHLAPEGALELAVGGVMLPGWFARQDVRAPGGEVLVPAGSRLSQEALGRLQRAGVTRLPVMLDDLARCVFARDACDESTGEVIAQPNEPVTDEVIARMREHQIEAFLVVSPEDRRAGPTLQRTLATDGFNRRFPGPLRDLIISVGFHEAAAITAARHLRGAKGCEDEEALALFRKLLGFEARYDLLEAGRRELYARLHAETPERDWLATAELMPRDVVEIIREVLARQQGEGLARDAEDAEADPWAEEKLVELVFRLDVEPPASSLRQRLLGDGGGSELAPDELTPAWSWVSAQRAPGRALRAADIEALQETYGPGLPQVKRHGAYRLVRKT